MQVQSLVQQDIKFLRPICHVEVISRIKIIALGETLVISGAPNDQMFSNVSEVSQMVFSMLRETLVNLKLP